MPTEYHSSVPVFAVHNPQHTFKMRVREPMPDSKCPICALNTLEHYPDLGRWRCFGGKCHSEFFHDDDGTINVRDFDPNFDIHGAFIIRRNWSSLVYQIKQWWKSLLAPKPPVKFELKSKKFDLATEIARIEAEDRQSFAYNPYAIWLAPDRWDGPAGTPFWMNDPKPVKSVTRTSHLPIQPPSNFKIDREGDEFRYLVDGEDYMLPSHAKPPTLYSTVEEREFAEFYRSKYKTMGAFRRAKTLRNKKRLT
jgi:hypothetical protein